MFSDDEQTAMKIKITSMHASAHIKHVCFFPKLFAGKCRAAEWVLRNFSLFSSHTLMSAA